MGNPAALGPSPATFSWFKLGNRQEDWDAATQVSGEAHQLHRCGPHRFCGCRVAGLIGEFLTKLFAVLFLAVAPTPMDPRNRKVRVGHHLGQALTGQGLTHVTAGNVLLEPGKNCLKGRRRIAKQGGIGHAARIE